MKLLDDFIAKNNNKPLEYYDAENLNQCFDLILAWIAEIGLKAIIPLGVKNAYELYDAPTQKIRDNFLLIKNTFDAVAQVGDIIVWNNRYGPAGHTAVCISADANNITAFSQNDPTGSKCVIKKYTYSKVSGWLRSKTLPVEPSPMPQLPKDLENYRTDWKEVAVAQGLDVNSTLLAPYRAIDQIISNKLKDQDIAYKDQLKKLQDENETLQRVNLEYEKVNETLGQANTDLQNKLADCKATCQEGKYNSLIAVLSEVFNKIKEVISDVLKQVKKNGKS